MCNQSKCRKAHALFSFRAQYYVIDISNCCAQEQSKAEFFCTVEICLTVLCVTEQSTAPHVLTVLEHGHMQNVIVYTVN